MKRHPLTYRDRTGVGFETDCEECRDKVDIEVICLEANVDPQDRGASEYLRCIRNGKDRCSKHGNDFYRKKK